MRALMLPSRRASVSSKHRASFPSPARFYTDSGVKNHSDRSAWSSVSSKVLGVGTDIVFVPRLHDLFVRQERRTLSRRGQNPDSLPSASNDRFGINQGEGAVDHFARRILTETEGDDFRRWRQDRQADFPTIEILRWLGARWAAKEAAYKALYPDYRLRWSDLEVHKSSPGDDTDQDRTSSPKPFLRFSKTFDPSRHASARPLPTLHLSLSHDGDYVLAFVIAESREQKVV
ncbi:unnamed protein product [Tilletia controversa]|nr:unnamed protein product [Tilletia controversa]CAD6930121.1 unnamed protein product [Tilletia controversa]CAD6932235.1 unnamed protein product [Tilletia controversa]CAD6947246.1 unnamed protein product [Tilletia controversa]